MPIKLSHIGEDLIAAMLSSLARRRQLGDIRCAVTERALIADIDEHRLTEPIAFRADDASLTVHMNHGKYMCDGEQTIDVLCTGGARALAIEAKLGETRMAAGEFEKRFCTPCEESRHSNSRLRGSMVAVLERSLPETGPCRLVAHAEGGQWEVARPWWLVVRKTVLDRWQKARRPSISSARYLVFDTLAALYGTRQQFDQLVLRVVGTEFAGTWDVPLRDP